MVRHLPLYIAFLVPALAVAQSGPGGVGNSNGASGQPLNRTWFRTDVAASLTRTTSGKVTRWRDQSGNLINADQTDTTLSPRYVASVLNSRPIVRFEGIPNACLTGTLASPVTTAQMTVFVVARNSASTVTVGGMLTFNGFQGLFHQNDAGVGYYVVDGNGANYNTSAASNPATVNTSNFHIVTGVYNRGGTNQSALFVDSKLAQHYLGTDKNTNTYSQVQVGGRTWGGLPTRIFNGDIAEAISYDTKLDSAQRIIVENYLSAKYAMPITNRKYAYWNTFYRNDVAGIGRANNGSQHVTAASSVVTITNPLSLQTNSFMMAGHNFGTLTMGTVETPDNDVAFTRRSVREWRFDKTGPDLGTVKLLIDYSIMNASLPAGFTRGIFIDEDGDFRIGSQFIDLQPFAGTVYQTPSITIPDGWHMTIGAVKRVVGFETATNSGFENTTQFPLIRAKINYPYAAGSGSNVIIDYSVAPLGPNAVTGPGDNNDINDFNTTRNQAVLPAGQQYIDLNNLASEYDAALEIHNDPLAEPNSETVRLTITGINGAEQGATLSHTYYLLDDDFLRKVAFQPAQIDQWNELNTGQYLDTALYVQLPVGQQGGPTTVSVVQTGNGRAGKDYRFLDAALASDSVFPVTIPTGQRIVRVRLRLLGDNTDEPRDTLTFSLFNPESGTLSQVDPIVRTIYINDNDAPPTVQFSIATGAAAESAGSRTLRVRLSEASGWLVRVPYTFNAASTASGSEVDYDNGSTSPLFFYPGDTAQNVVIDITDDEVEEDEETVIVDLGSPLNASLGNPTQHILTIVDNDAYGSNGPGGVDKANGQGTLALWMRADKGLTQSGAAVTQWGDQSGNNFNASQGTNSKRPTVVSSALNGKPVVRFNATNKQNVAGTFLPTQRSFPIQFVAVAKDNGTTASYGDIICTNRYAGITSYKGQQYLNDALTTSPGFVDATPANSSNTAIDVPRMQQWNVISSQYLTNSTQNSSMWLNGTLAENYTGTGPRIDNHTSFVLGSRNNPEPSAGVANYFNGDLAEVIFFTTDLNEPRRIIVENYLAAKYSLTIANDYYTGHDAAYINDVAGVGTTSGTGIQKHRTGSSAGLTLRQTNNTLNSANEFLLVGHNSTGNAVIYADINGTSHEIWNRSWYFDKTGAIDQKITFDYSDAGLQHTAIPVDEYFLLFRATASGSWTKLPVVNSAKTLVGDAISFQLANSEYGDGYYTLGRTDPGLLPIELSSFDAYRQGSEVKVRWSTAHEEYASYFEVERSADVKTWAPVGRVSAAGFTTKTQNYLFTDEAPLQGRSYYRLRQVDVDGVTSIGPVREVNLQSTSGFGKLAIFPNPVTNLTTISVEGFEGGQVDVTLTDLKGQIVYRTRHMLSSGKASLNLGHLPAAIYTLRTDLDTGEVHLRKLIKE